MTYNIGPMSTGTPFTNFSNAVFGLCPLKVGRTWVYHRLT